MQPDSSTLLRKIDLDMPLIGFYDVPDTRPFEPVVRPEAGKHVCLFAFFVRWLDGYTVHITRENYGCGGAGHWLCDVTTRSRDDYLKFLVGDEGLKSSRELMGKWFDHHRPYQQEHPHLMIGPLKADQYDYCKTVTFFVNPDQLSALMIGANYHAGPDDRPAVIAPFGSGCMELVTLFEDLSVPQAVIGTTDIAMRQYLPPDILAFTVTVPMFEQLCGLDEKSFLFKPFWKNLRRARGLLKD